MRVSEQTDSGDVEEKAGVGPEREEEDDDETSQKLWFNWDIVEITAPQWAALH